MLMSQKKINKKKKEYLNQERRRRRRKSRNGHGKEEEEEEGFRTPRESQLLLLRPRITPPQQMDPLEEAKRKQHSILRQVQGELLKNLGKAPILAPYTPTPQSILDTVLEFGKVGAGDHIFDIGCGDGRLLCSAAERFGARGLGWDIEPAAIKDAEALIASKALGSLVEVRCEDITRPEVISRVDWGVVTVVVMYLSIQGNLTMRPVVLKNVRKGTKVITVQFGMGDWVPKAQCVVPYEGHHKDSAGIPLFLYEVDDESDKYRDTSERELSEWTLKVSGI